MGVPIPPTIPQCPIPGNTRQRVDSRVRTPTDAGPHIVRNRYTARTTNLTWTLPPMTGAQVQALEAFYDNDLEKGVLRADVNDVLTGNVVEVRFLSEPRKIGIVPDDVAAERLWRVSIELEIMP